MAARMLEVANLIIEVFEPPFRYEIALEFPVYVSRLRTVTCSATIILGKLHIGVQDASIREPWAAWVSAHTVARQLSVMNEWYLVALPKSMNGCEASQHSICVTLIALAFRHG
jgi:hypothetical protein